MEILNEAIEVVEKLNQEVYDYFENYGLTYSLLELKTDGFSIIINFMGQHRLWFSEEDEREFDDEINEYEPLEQYLRRETQEIINQIGGIKLLK